MKQEYENGFTKLYKRIESMSPELQEIYWKHWDESGSTIYRDKTGEPAPNRSEIAAIIDILKKNGSVGIVGFKLDMSNFFEKEKFSDKQLDTYYSVFIGGAKFMSERFAKGVEETASSKVKKPA